KELFATFRLRHYFRAQRLSRFLGEHVPERFGALALRDGPLSFESPTVEFGRSNVPFVREFTNLWVGLYGMPATPTTQQHLLWS
ncbi:MAG TPA: hypothetical protein VGH04_02585, partial [Gemmatimonadaceae bacterium]